MDGLVVLVLRSRWRTTPPNVLFIFWAHPHASSDALWDNEKR